MNRRLYHTFLKFRTGLVVLFALLSIYDVKAQNLVPDQTEFQVLKDLYDQLGGTNWNHKENWPTTGNWPASAASADFVTWEGVSVVDGDIIGLNLYQFNLNGQLPSSLQNLTALTYLELEENQLTGAIPSWIGNLSNLEYLSLSINPWSGPIPASLGNLKKLTNIRIALCSGVNGSIPEELGGMESLEQLTLWGNNLSGTIPSSLGNLKNLLYFVVSQNSLVGSLPPSLGQLSKLISFQVNDNQLSGDLPSTLSGLTQLISMELFNNQFSGGLPVLTELPSLRNIYLMNNHFSGSLPEFKPNSQLYNIRLSYNQLSGSIPSSIENLTNLVLLDLEHNNLSGAVPGAINNIPWVYYVDFSHNDFTSLEQGAYTYATRPNLNLFLEGNHLDFSVLETLKQSMSAASYLALLPQQEVKEAGQVGFKIGETLTVNVSANRGQYSTVNWEKQSGTDWLDVTASNEDVSGQIYKRNSATQNDVGTYRWKMTNSQVTGDAIYSTPMRVDTEMQLTLDNFAYQYDYDERQRMTHKKVPGADWVYMVYDNRDRLVLTQDGNQRADKEWTFTKYDVLNRPVMTGIYTHESVTDQAGMQEVVNTFYTNLSTPIENPAAWYETFSLADGNKQGYDNRSFPRANTNPLTISYYDNYEFLTRIGPHYEYDTDGLSQTVTAQNQTYTQPANEKINRGVIGQVTGSSVKDLGTGTWLNTVTYYDDKYRAVQVISDNAQGGSDKTSNLYDFVGKVLQTQTTHKKGTLKWAVVNYSLTTPNQIIKTGDNNMGWWAGGFSQQYLPGNANGWVEWIASERNSWQLLGLSATNVGANYMWVDYGIMQGDNNIGIFEQGSQVAGFNDLLSEGDVLKIVRENGVTTYYHNTTLLYTSSHTTNAALYVDASIANQGNNIRNIRTSFAPEEISYTLRTLTYDHAGRLLTTKHSIDGATPILLSKNEYNELGQLVDKKLHSTQENGSDAKQSVDYRYNIRGWLTSINNADLSVTNTTINNDSDITKKDLFGMELAYEKEVAGLTSAANNEVQYNGNISAITYSNNLSLGAIKSNGYKYAYDPMNRLLSSNFRQKKNNSWALTEYLNGTTPLSKEAYSETGFEYDLNGNIMKLNRSGAATTSSSLMDQLDYTYEGNQLLHVDDDGDKIKGFIDGNVTGDDYSYDANGNMTVDKNKGITAITYNHLNLPDKVTKDNGDYIKYSYDATGRKLSQQVYDAYNTLKKKSDYAGEYFYENDTLKFINHEEGRVTMAGSAPEYQYHLKDHLGNVRTTFTTKEEIDESKATNETATMATERSQFIDYDKAQWINSVIYDHTYDGQTAPAEGTYAQRLNGSDKEKLGMAKSLSVMPGDKIDIQVYAKYFDASNNNNDPNFASLMAAIISGTGIPAQTIIDGTGYALSANNSLPFVSGLDKSTEGNATPKAYLNWIVFNRDYVQDMARSGYKRVTEGKEDGTNKSHQLLKPDNSIEIAEPGFVYIWLSNENETPVEVYFDDFKVTHTKSPVVQQEEYYAFGLTFNGYQRENVLMNNYQFNSKEIQEELNLNTIDFGWRQYDPTIGRWNVIDQLAEKYYPMTPYNFVANNPINFIDPDGREIASGSKKEWDTQRNSVERTRDRLQRKIDRLEAKAERKGWSSEKLENKTATLSSRVSILNTNISTLDRLERSSQVYRLAKTNGELGGTTYDTNSGDVVIAFGSTANFVHETTHAGQFENEEVAFNSTNGNSLGQDVYDEINAYRAQWSYDPSSVSQLNSSSVANSYGAITATWVQGITAKDGTRPYSQGGSANTGIIPINIDSNTRTLMQAYPSQISRFVGVPDNYSLRSSKTTYYNKTNLDNGTLCH